MSQKINIIEIVKGHIGTLRDSNSKKLNFADTFTFFILPCVIAAFGIIVKFELTKALISLLINFGAIFTALLLSVLVLVYDQENKVHSENRDSDLYSLKIQLLRELYYNICFAIIASIVLVILSFFDQCIIEFSFKIPAIVYFGTLEHEIHPARNVVTPIIIFIAGNISLTILMIVKRLHVLLTTTLTDNPQGKKKD